MEMDEEYIEKVKGLIEQKDAASVKELLTDLHPADIAELCNELDLEEARFVYRLLDNETAADVLVEMDEDMRKELLDALPSETIAKRFVDYMDTDDAVELMRDLDEDKQEEVLSHIGDIERIAAGSKPVDTVDYVGRRHNDGNGERSIGYDAGGRDGDGARSSSIESDITKSFEMTWKWLGDNFESLWD